MSEATYAGFKDWPMEQSKIKNEFISVTETDLLDEDSLSDDELKSINNNVSFINELKNDTEFLLDDDRKDIEKIIDGFTVEELNNLQLMLNKRRSRMCAPLSWKKERDKDLKPVSIVKSIRENRWYDGLKQLKTATRKRYEDLVIETHYNFYSNEPGDTIVSSVWVFAILSLYDENKDLPSLKDYVKVTAYINDIEIVDKIYNREYGFDIIDYLLRARHTWKKQSKFIDGISAIV